jgi:hypothetical protein
MIRSVVIAAALVALAIGCGDKVSSTGVKSGDEQGKPEVVLPGSKVSLVDAVKKANAIVVATIVKLREDDPSNPFADGYEADLEITKVLKGGLKEKKLRVMYKVVWDPPTKKGDPKEEKPQEESPQEKGSYIFFLKVRQVNDIGGLKILEDTEANQAAVAKALAPKPGDDKK